MAEPAGVDAHRSVDERRHGRPRCRGRWWWCPSHVTTRSPLSRQTAVPWTCAGVGGGRAGGDDHAPRLAAGPVRHRTATPTRVRRPTQSDDIRHGASRSFRAWLLPRGRRPAWTADGRQRVEVFTSRTADDISREHRTRAEAAMNPAKADPAGAPSVRRSVMTPRTPILFSIAASRDDGVDMRHAGERAARLLLARPLIPVNGRQVRSQRPGVRAGLDSERPADRVCHLRLRARHASEWRFPPETRTACASRRRWTASRCWPFRPVTNRCAVTGFCG